MILSLHLVNFTIISELHLEFDKGMSVLTGETGAGKSIIIDAIQLALGARLESKVVREGTQKSIISLHFDISKNQPARQWLSDKDFLAEDDCILRRTINKEGRSKAFINEHPVTLQTLSELGEMLLNIHGQHQHQSLIQKEKQLQMLDRFGDHEKQVATVYQVARQWHNLKKTYDGLLKTSSTQNQQKEFLQFQLAEFEKLSLEENEVSLLDDEHRQLTHCEDIIEAVNQVHCLLTEEDTCVSQQLNYSISKLEPIANLNSELSNALEQLNSILIQVEEVSQDIRRQLDSVQANPERLAFIENRLSKIHDLARKHHVSAKDLLDHQQNLQESYDALDNSEATLDKLTQALKVSEAQYLEASIKLSAARKKTAKKLSDLITKDIQSLNMKDGQFHIKIQPLEQSIPNLHGQERLEFQVAANLGQSLQPLSKVASGGELSRISLAIQVNLAQKMQTPVLIFDEVDTGIGGATAEIVGLLLQKLAKDTQVFCITHLAQVASKANHHFRVSKQSDGQQTYTQVNALSKDETIEEIARMIGGIKLTKASLEHAKSLL